MKAKPIFIETLGSSPVIKILDHLITGRELDFSLSNIAEGSEVGWMTVHRVLPKLLKLGIVKHTRVIGQAKMYKIDTENPIAQELIKLYDHLLKLVLEELEIKAVA